MRSDDLHRELDLIAPDADGIDLKVAMGDVRRRVARRRARIGGVGALAGIVVAVGIAFAVSVERDDRIGITTQPDSKLVPQARLDRIDAVVTMPPLVSVDALREVDDALAHDEAVERYSRTSPAAEVLRSALGSECGDWPRWVVETRPGSVLEGLPAPAAVVSPSEEYSTSSYDGQRWTGGADAEVFLLPRATQPQIDAVRRRLEQLTGVIDVDLFDHDDAFAEFRRLFAASPDLIENVRPEDLPSSFRVALESDDPQPVTDALDGQAGVWRVVQAPAWYRTVPELSVLPFGLFPELDPMDEPPDGTEMEIYVNPGATADEVTALRDQLDDDPRVRDFQYLDQDDAFGEFARLFESSPELVENVDAKDLPASFRVELGDPDDAAGVEADLGGRAGVWRVVSSASVMNSFSEGGPGGSC
jgi:cell division protein FtsX